MRKTKHLSKIIPNDPIHLCENRIYCFQNKLFNQIFTLAVSLALLTTNKTWTEDENHAPHVTIIQDFFHQWKKCGWITTLVIPAENNGGQEFLQRWSTCAQYIHAKIVKFITNFTGLVAVVQIIFHTKMLVNYIFC